MAKAKDETAEAMAATEEAAKEAVSALVTAELIEEEAAEEALAAVLVAEDIEVEAD